MRNALFLFFLLAVAGKYQLLQLDTLLRNGKGTMPSFGHIPAKERQALVAFLLGKEQKNTAAADEAPPTPYTMAGYVRFVTKDGYPAIRPPWGTLNAIDLNTGKRVWQVPLGAFPELMARGIPPTGTENYGGPVTTAGGLVFIGASKDGKFRAFDKKTGKMLFETALPAGGYATPATYMVGGKQYVAIACGGGKMGTKSGDSYVAFALP